jgi:hypothetical protein
MENTIPEFVQVICNVVEREIMLHLCDPTSGVRAIKFGYIHPRKAYVPLKVMGLKGMGRSFTFSLFMCVRKRVIERDVEFGADCGNDIFKFMSYFHHGGLHGYLDRCIYGGIYGGITGDKSSIELLHFLLGLTETNFQGVEARLMFLATGVGHEDG